MDEMVIFLHNVVEEVEIARIWMDMHDLSFTTHIATYFYFLHGQHGAN